MGLPCPPDANIDEYNYCELDSYTHCNGAKIWLVPSDCYTVDGDSDGNKVTTWSPSGFLFETDMIWYDDVGSSVGLTAAVDDIIAISVNPSSINFGTLIPGSTSAMKDITVKNMGTCTVDVDADLSGASATLFRSYLQLKNKTIGTPDWKTRAWPKIVDDLVKGNFEVLRSKLPVPSTYTPAGPELGTLVFEASPA